MMNYTSLIVLFHQLFPTIQWLMKRNKKKFDEWKEVEWIKWWMEWFSHWMWWVITFVMFSSLHPFNCFILFINCFICFPSLSETNKVSGEGRKWLRKQLMRTASIQLNLNLIKEWSAANARTNELIKLN